MTRLAVIGVGREVDAYSRIVGRLPGAQFTAVADPDRGRTLSAAARLGADSACASLDELLRRHAAEFDAVLIHAPACLHAPLALEAAGARKHVLIEPPLASSLEEGDRILSACRAAGVRIMPASVDRFLPSVRTIKNVLDSGKLGAPGLLRVHRWEPKAAAEGADRWSVGDSDDSLLFRRALGEIDLARWLFGQLPTELCVTGRPDSGVPQQGGGPLAASDYVQLHLGFPNGGMALIDCAETLPAGAGYTSRSLIGATGAAYADDHHDMQLVYRGGAPAAVRTTEEDAALLAMLREFVESIGAGREPAVTGTDGREAVRIAEAAAKCLAAGRTARLSGSTQGAGLGALGAGATGTGSGGRYEFV